MKDSGFVGRGKSAPELPREASGRTGTQGSALEACLESLSFEVLEHQKEAQDGIFPHVMKSDDARMRDPGRGAGLLPHALEEGASLFVRYVEVITQELDRDLTIQDGVFREVDSTHGAEAESSHHVIATNRGRQRRRFRHRGARAGSSGRRCTMESSKMDVLSRVSVLAVDAQ
jgi:hypothetical protein